MAKLSRRDFLKAVVVGIVSLSGAKIVRAQVKSEKSLKIYNWSYYIDETLLDEFSEYAGIPRSRIVYDEYDDPNVVLSKLEAGKSGYDVVILPDYVLDIARRKNLLLELNKSLIPNYSKVDEKFRSTPYDPEGKYSVVYMWGSTGFGYRSDLAEKITSLKQIFDPSYGFLEKYKRKITMLEEPMEVILSCKAYLGKAPDDWSDSTMNEVKEVLIKQKDYLAAYAGANVYYEGLKNASIYVAHAYNGDIVRLQYEEGLKEVSFAIPEEGATIWTDSMCIPRDAENIELAHEFINFMLEPEISARNSEYIKYASPVTEAKEYISEEILNNPAVYIPTELYKKMWYTPSIDDATRRKIENLMIEVKAAKKVPGFEMALTLAGTAAAAALKKKF